MSDVRSSLSRRNLIQSMGVGAAALALAGCASTDKPTPSAASDRTADRNTLRVDSWETYRNTSGEDYPLLAQFSGMHGVDVTYSATVREDNQYLQGVKSQLEAGADIGADAVVLSSWMAARWIRNGWAQDFARDRMPNIDGLRPRFVEAPYDPTRSRSLPWRIGFTGLAWNKNEVSEPLTSVSQLWEPRFKGRVSALSDMRSSIGLIMLDNGVDIAGAWGEAEFTRAVDVMRTHVANKHIFSIKGSRYLDDLRSGQTIAAVANSADIARLVAESSDEWGFAIPDAGGVLWTQDIVVPVGSTSRTQAENFINFYYDPRTAAAVASQTFYPTPVDIRESDKEGLPLEAARNPFTFPSMVTLQDVKFFRHLTEAEESKYRAQYQTVLLAAG